MNANSYEEITTTGTEYHGLVLLLDKTEFWGDNGVYSSFLISFSSGITPDLGRGSSGVSSADFHRVSHTGTGCPARLGRGQGLLLAVPG